jgi:hypothetical protein
MQDLLVLATRSESSDLSEWFRRDLTAKFAGNAPTPRSAHGFTSSGCKLYVHGGSTDKGKFFSPFSSAKRIGQIK